MAILLYLLAWALVALLAAFALSIRRHERLLLKEHVGPLAREWLLSADGQKYEILRVEVGDTGRPPRRAAVSPLKAFHITARDAWGRIRQCWAFAADGLVEVQWQDRAEAPPPGGEAGASPPTSRARSGTAGSTGSGRSNAESSRAGPSGPPASPDRDRRPRPHHSPGISRYRTRWAYPA
jgi:hypothetical protein